MTTNGGFDSNPTTRPALSGHLGSDYERRISGGGSGNKEFASPSEVRDVFFRGIELLGERLATVSNEYNVDATMARVRLRSRAIAKSHRHPTLFNTDQTTSCWSTAAWRYSCSDYTEIAQRAHGTCSKMLHRTS